MNSSRKAEYRPVSHGQKHQCMWCGDEATQDCALRQGNLTVINSCCDDPKCMWRSADKCERTVGAA